LQFGKRKHKLWDDPVGDMLTYLFKLRPWVKKAVAIAQNAKAFDLHFILESEILCKWQPELIMNGMKIMCMKKEHTVLLNSTYFLSWSLYKLPDEFDVTASISWCSHYFKTEENLVYIALSLTSNITARTR
jgi:hypothetical protein